MSIGNLTYDSAAIATPSDITPDPFGPFVAFIIWGPGGGGTVSFVDQSGNSIPASGTLPIGTLIRVKGTRINATGTTATVLICKAPI